MLAAIRPQDAFLLDPNARALQLGIWTQPFDTTGRFKSQLGKNGWQGKGFLACLKKARCNVQPSRARSPPEK